jgi:chorismate mutase / prephenate dehydrogenase
MPESELKRLRGALARADRTISRAIEHRMALAHQIGVAKRTRGLPVRDYAVEREVVERWKRSLERSHVPPERAEILARWLVEESVKVQEDLGEPSRTPRTGSEVLVVGGAGAMGQWMCGFFRSDGHEVGIFDPRARPREYPLYRVHRHLEPAVRRADAIVVATPMRVTPKVYRKIADGPGHGLLFDILSIKSPILEEIRHALRRGWKVTSVHPLFGPSTRTLSARNLLVLDCGDAEANSRVTGLFGRSSLSITQLPIAKHDALMGRVLALPHVVSLLFSTVLANSDLSATQLATLAPTSFLREAEVARVVANENPELVFDIQSLNPASSAVYTQLGSALRTLRRAAITGDRETYDHLLSGARNLWNAE